MMIQPGIDEFGYTRTDRLAMVDAEFAEAREMARTGNTGDCRGTLHGAAAMYAAFGHRLLARRVTQLARSCEDPAAWERFDRLNATA